MSTEGLYRDRGEVVVDAAGNQVNETEADYIARGHKPLLENLPTKEQYAAKKLAEQLALMTQPPGGSASEGSDA